MEIASTNKLKFEYGKSLSLQNSRVLLLVKKFAPLFLLTASLAACAGNRPPIATTADNIAKVRCSGWKKLSYDSKEDTAETIVEIREHNLYGEKRGCWSSKGKK
jgi:hypothetical protein